MIYLSTVCLTRRSNSLLGITKNLNRRREHGAHTLKFKRMSGNVFFTQEEMKYRLQTLIEVHMINHVCKQWVIYRTSLTNNKANGFLYAYEHLGVMVRL